MKAKKYTELVAQITSLLSSEPDMIANLSNIAALLQAAFGHHWTGFYLAQGDSLVLGPFQGPIACTRIPKGRGVCGTSWSQMQTIIVPDVHAFPGHIACSSLSNSEIVVPIFTDDRFLGVIDVDSVEFDTFDSRDRDGLEAIARLIASRYL